MNMIKILKLLGLTNNCLCHTQVTEKNHINNQMLCHGVFYSPFYNKVSVPSTIQQVSQKILHWSPKNDRTVKILFFKGVLLALFLRQV